MNKIPKRRTRLILTTIISLLVSVFCVAVKASVPSAAYPEFHFESIKTLDKMSAFIRSNFSLGSSRNEMRKFFLTQGKATLKIHPSEAGVEKYMYDINLCNYYIWRWNISADYDANGKLQQAYINGNIVFPNGKPKKIISKETEKGKKASILKVQRPRPEAYKGEASLGFILFDRDSNLKTTDDQAIAGVGPIQADPANMGKMTAYTDVDPWRSIFDSDDVNRIAPYQGDCTAANKKWLKSSSQNQR